MTKLPYLPEGRKILYVPENKPFMQAAKQAAETISLDPQHPIGAVVVQDGKIIGRGANGSWFHKGLGCVRKWFGVPTGKGYWMCPGCQPRHHAEPSALKDVRHNGHDPQGADIYLWGHWWCCQSCWEKMMKADIYRVFLVEGAEEKFR